MFISIEWKTYQAFLLFFYEDAIWFYIQIFWYAKYTPNLIIDGMQIQMKTINIWLLIECFFLLSFCFFLRLLLFERNFSDIHRMFWMPFIRTDNILTCLRFIYHVRFFPSDMLQFVCCYYILYLYIRKRKEKKTKLKWLAKQSILATHELLNKHEKERDSLLRFNLCCAVLCSLQ